MISLKKTLISNSHISEKFTAPSPLGSKKSQIQIGALIFFNHP